MTGSNALAPRPSLFQMTISSFEEGLRFAEMVSKSQLCPQAFKGRAGDCFLAMQMGAELGLSPMAALQNIAVINGRPSLWGDALLAIVLVHPLCEDVIETPATAQNGWVASCEVRRRGMTPKVRTFSMAEAQKARLWGKAGPWQDYPHRMLQMRARAFALRDSFPDALRGLSVAEEVLDAVGETVHVQQVGAPAPALAPVPAPAALPAAAPMAPVVAAVQAAQQAVQAAEAAQVITLPVGGGEAFEIRSGKNKGKRMGSLVREAIDWYATECKDPATKAAAIDCRNRRIAREANMNGVEVIDRHTGEVFPGHAPAAE